MKCARGCVDAPPRLAIAELLASLPVQRTPGTAGRGQLAAMADTSMPLVCYALTSTPLKTNYTAL